MIRVVLLKLSYIYIYVCVCIYIHTYIHTLDLSISSFFSFLADNFSDFTHIFIFSPKGNCWARSMLEADWPNKLTNMNFLLR